MLPFLLPFTFREQFFVMARNKTTVRFEVRLDKPDNTGLVPIRMVYQVAGQRKYFNAGRKIYPEMWDDEAQEVIYLDKAVAKKLLPSVPHAQLPLAREVSSINHDLQALREAIKAIEDGFRFEGEAFSASMVINKLNEKIKPKTKREDPSTYVADFILHQFVPDSENRIYLSRGSGKHSLTC